MWLVFLALAALIGLGLLIVTGWEDSARPAPPKKDDEPDP